MGAQTLRQERCPCRGPTHSPLLTCEYPRHETSCALATGPAHLSCMCGPCWVCGDSFRAVSLGPTMEGNGGTGPNMALAWDASSTGA